MTVKEWRLGQGKMFHVPFDFVNVGDAVLLPGDNDQVTESIKTRVGEGVGPGVIGGIGVAVGVEKIVNIGGAWSTAEAVVFNRAINNRSGINILTSSYLGHNYNSRCGF